MKPISRHIFIGTRGGGGAALGAAPGLELALPTDAAAQPAVTGPAPRTEITLT